jgi:protein-L-isoaspartate(D-aspartate) O-methyltransferase
LVKAQLQDRDITDPRVLRAMSTIPREKFIPPKLHHLAYADQPLPIGHGQTITQPYLVALTCQLCAFKGHETVLDIGTGSGYQAAVLSLLVKHVISLEIVGPLAQAAAARLNRLGYENVTVIHTDGRHGYAQKAPYHAIASAAASRQVPPAWINQLAPHGVIVLPQKRLFRQYLTRYQKTNGSLIQEEILPVRFVPLT